MKVIIERIGKTPVERDLETVIKDGLRNTAQSMTSESGELEFLKEQVDQLETMIGKVVDLIFAGTHVHAQVRKNFVDDFVAYDENVVDVREEG